ncbi:MAG: hypothetical protein HYR85_07465 [Planctomycetes bacterium]|nr:hypothetical protein [Planctomycetota bacterium]
MGKLDGVQSVAFDCKTATVTMKPGAVLTRDVAERVLKAEKFGVKSFENGAAPTVTAYVFQITGLAEGSRDTVRRRLAADVPDASEVVVDSTGSATITLKGNGTLDEKALASSLRACGCATRAVEKREWPKITASYELGVRDLSGDDAPVRVREALGRLDKVLAAYVFRDTNTARIELREPCEKIEAAAREALRAIGLEVSRFERRSA